MQVRKGHSLITQQDIVDVLDKQLLEGMGVLLTEEEQQKCEQNVSYLKHSPNNYLFFLFSLEIFYFFIDEN